jgi:hypothetical protein
MAQQNISLTKSYYRRWFLGLTLCPGYRFFHERKTASRFKRFNTTASHFDLEEVLDIGFDNWWDKNQIKLQSAIPTDYFENLEINCNLTTKEIERIISLKKMECNSRVNEESLQLDNLTIIDSSSGKDHKDIDLIDKLVSTRILKFIKEISFSPQEFLNKNDYQQIKHKNIYDLVNPDSGKEAPSINSSENRITEWNNNFCRVFWYAQFGYFYYDSESKSQSYKSKERKLLETKTPNFDSKTDFYSAHASLFDISHRESFIDFIDPAKNFFFSIEKLIKIITAFCPETLNHSHKNPLDRLPSLKSKGKIGLPLIKLSYDNNFEKFESNIMWNEIKPYLNELFSNDLNLKLVSAYKISEIIIEHTTIRDTVNSINPVKLKIIASVLPFLFQENKNSGRKKYGSLTLLWKERPNLFIETENMFFGTSILIRSSLVS